MIKKVNVLEMIEEEKKSEESAAEEPVAEEPVAEEPCLLYTSPSPRD